MLTKCQLAQLQVLVDYLNNNRLTQKRIAEATGVHQSQISRILAGRSRRPSRNLLKLCKYAEELNAPGEAADSHDEEIVKSIRSLLGDSSEGDQRLRDVVISLKAWRDSWRAKI